MFSYSALRRSVHSHSAPSSLPLRSLRIEQLEHRRLLSVSPKNVILMIGDGMGFEQVEAGRYKSGNPLCFESFPAQTEMTTHSANSAVTDSAASGTAMATGTKVNNDVISMAYPGDGSELTTSLEIHRDLGKMTGLVSTTFMTHATPATFGAHESSRSNYAQIAVDYLYQTRPNVLFGGGANGLAAETASDAGYTVVTTAADLANLNTETASHVSGQFGADHLPYELDGLGTLPGLSEMTTTALAILDNGTEGFFLMVEGGRIDHAGHANDLARLQAEVVEFSNAVQEVVNWVDANEAWEETLLIVTADHETGGLDFDSATGLATWSTDGHTAANVPIYARGVGATIVVGILDNTDIFALTTNLQSAAFQQDVNGYQGAVDTNLFEDTPSIEYGAAVSLNVDGDEPAGTSRDAQALLRFGEIFGTNAGQIPLDAEITSARLELNITNPGDSVSLHRMLKTWDANVTWQSLGEGIAADGVEALAVADASTASQVSGIVSIGVTASLLAWQADPLSNYGWVLLPTGGDGVDFDSSEGMIPPKLVVTYRAAETDPSAPVAVDDAYGLEEDGVLSIDVSSGILNNDSDPENDPLIAVLVQDVSHGDLTLAADGSFIYIPNPDFNGVDWFTYTANDGQHSGNIATVTLTVDSVNDVPGVKAPIGDMVLDEDAVDRVMSLLEVFEDVDILTNEDELIFEVIENSNAPLVSAGVIDHLLTLHFMENQHGTSTIRVRATDSAGAWVEDEFRVDVNPVNDVPLLVNPLADLTVDEGTAQTILDLSGVFDDPDIVTDGDALTVLVSGNDNADLVTPEIDGSVLTLHYAPNRNGTANITVRAVDQSGEWVEDTLLVTVAAASVDDRAIGEMSTHGTLSGAQLEATYANDGVYEVLQEVPYAGNRSRLEHTWEFDVTGGEAVTFYLEAHHDSTAEGFVFDYSIDGLTWTTMLNVVKTHDDNVYQTYSLPESTQGTVFIRVTDTDRSKEPSLDAIYVDDMFIQSARANALPVVSLAATDATAAEEGPDPGTFTVTRSGSTSGDLVVAYTIGGTATAGDDYLTLSGSVTIADGASSATIEIVPIDDAMEEGDETVTLTLAADAGYAIGSASADTVTILDNDAVLLPVVSLAATDATAAEEGTDSGTFTVTRSGSTSGDLVVAYTIGGTATAGDDYVTLSGSVTIADGASSATIEIVPIDDAMEEGDETVILTLAADAGYVIGSASTDTVTILDNDNDVTWVDYYAVSERPVQGGVTGNLENTRGSDDGYEVLQEAKVKGKSELEHWWTFNVSGGDTVTFYIEAYRNPGALEDFEFQYSTDGENWTTMLTITKTEDDNQYQTYELPSLTEETIYVRAVDTDRTNGETGQDSLFIDDMFFRVE